MQRKMKDDHHDDDDVDGEEEEEETLTLKSLPSQTYAVMVHKLYLDRVVDFLTTTTTSSNSRLEEIPRRSSSSCDKVAILDIPELTGVSRARRGYVVVLLEETQRCLSTLSPLARQNISWVGRITHAAHHHHQQQHENNEKDGAMEKNGKNYHDPTASNKFHTSDPIMSSRLGMAIWKSLSMPSLSSSSSTTTTSSSSQSCPFDRYNPTHWLRVDVHPRHETIPLCRLLQRAAVLATTRPASAGGSKKRRVVSSTQNALLVNDLPASLSVNQESLKVANGDDSATPFVIDTNDDYNDDEKEEEDDDDPFEHGPISFTKSRSKCSHRLTVIFAAPHPSPQTASIVAGSSERGWSSLLSASSSIGGGGSSRSSSSSGGGGKGNASCWWGWETRLNDHNGDNDHLLDLALNHEAAEQVIVVAEPPNQEEDHEKNNNTMIPVESPLSRAYYKLHQVWTDYLPKDDLRITQGSGLDLGACPGGWTQVLVHVMGLCHVTSVDAAPLAARVARLPQVKHVAAHLQTLSILDLLLQHNGTTVAPYSMVVCDASIMWSELMDELLKRIQVWMDSYHNMLSDENNDNGDQKPLVLWCRPLTWVITMKLPFKTIGSIQRHVQQMHERLPRDLERMASILFPFPKNNATDGSTKVTPIRTRFRVVHLMANSDSERTLIAVFE